MFKRLDNNPGRTVAFQFDGQVIQAFEGDSIAAALLANGVTSLRDSTVSGASRAPYCMMGACYDCVVKIDGKTVQACITPVQEGLLVERPVARGDDGAAD